MGLFFLPLQQGIPTDTEVPNPQNPTKTTEQNRKAQLAETYQISAPAPFLFTHHTAHSFIFCTGPLLPYSQGFPPRFFPGNTPMGLSCPVPAPFPGVTPLPPHLWRGNFFLAVLVLFYCYYSFKVRIKGKLALGTLANSTSSLLWARRVLQLPAPQPQAAGSSASSLRAPSNRGTLG